MLWATNIFLRRSQICQKCKAEKLPMTEMQSITYSHSMMMHLQCIPHSIPSLNVRLLEQRYYIYFKLYSVDLIVLCSYLMKELCFLVGPTSTDNLDTLEVLKLKKCSKTTMRIKRRRMMKKSLNQKRLKRSDKMMSFHFNSRKSYLIQNRYRMLSFHSKSLLFTVPS